MTKKEKSEAMIELFKKHPEYFILRDSDRTGRGMLFGIKDTSLCIQVLYGNHPLPDYFLYGFREYPDYVRKLTDEVFNSFSTELKKIFVFNMDLFK